MILEKGCGINKFFVSKILPFHLKRKVQAETKNKKETQAKAKSF